MRILFDQGTPKPLSIYLPRHVVVLAHQAGWSTLINGELLAAAELAGHELLITTDKNLQYQQNLKSRKIGIIVLGVGNWPRIERSVDLVIQAVERASIGTFEEIEFPKHG
jgi:hypothetical protein